jgi:hypothetical protein
MQDTILTFYCVCDDFLKAMNHTDDPQVKLTTAEVMTVSLVASCFFGGNINQARLFLVEHGYLSWALSESRLNRRLHAVPLEMWHTLFRVLAEVFKACNSSRDYIVDSMPVPVCDNPPRGHPASAAVASLLALIKKSIVGASPVKDAISSACACICW